jgi:glycerophosphoryl diester phosphodiesterase
VTELAPLPAATFRQDSSLEVTPAVVAHRGASGYRPEHTLEAHRLAVRMGADDIELDLVSTRDGVLVVRHGTELSATTDVAGHPEFARRRTVRTVDGVERAGWFVEDFTLAELKRLTARERHPVMRPECASYDGQLGIPTFNEVLAMVRAESVRARRVVGVMVELKHPTYFESLGLPLEVPLLADLRRHELDHARSRVSLMSFETRILQRLAEQSGARVVQLLGPRRRRPFDLAAAGDARTYADLGTPAGLARIAGYADGVGAHKSLVLPRDREGRLGRPTGLVRDAHRRWLTVHVWTLRRENRYLPTDLRGGESPRAHGDLAAEARAFLSAGVDGVITDHPDLVLETRDAAARRGPRRRWRQRVGIRIQATT